MYLFSPGCYELCNTSRIRSFKRLLSTDPAGTKTRIFLKLSVNRFITGVVKTGSVWENVFMSPSLPITGKLASNEIFSGMSIIRSQGLYPQEKESLTWAVDLDRYLMTWLINLKSG